MARRKKSNPLEDVLDLLAMLPWWVCLVLAAVSYFLLHRLAVPIQASDIQGQGGAIAGAMMQKAVIHGLATAGQYIVPLLCIAAAALSAWRRKQRQALVSDVAQARNADALDGMSWREFELLVGEAYRLQGYRVTEIGGGGPDGGVDLVLTKGSENSSFSANSGRPTKSELPPCVNFMASWRPKVPRVALSSPRGDSRAMPKTSPKGATSNSLTTPGSLQ